jgi:hypothetical protein
MPLKSLSLDQLIGAPLRALVVGEQAAARATADFISEVGFERAEGPPTVRQVEFAYLHPVPDPANPGAVVETPTRVRIPLLTMIPVPSIRISEATVAFGANVTDVKTVRTAPRAIALQPAGIAASTSRLQAVYAPAVSAPGQPAPTISLSIKVTKEPTSEGLTRVLDLLADAMTSSAKGK